MLLSVRKTLHEWHPFSPFTLKNSGPSCNLKQGATVKRVIVKCPTKHTNTQNKKIPCALVRLCVFSSALTAPWLSSPQLYYCLTRYFTVCRRPDLLSVWLNMCVYFCQGYYSQFTLKFKSPHIWGQLWSKRLHLSIMSMLYLHLCHFIITLIQRRQRSWWKCIWAINATILSNGGLIQTQKTPLGISFEILQTSKPTASTWDNHRN